MRKDIVRELYQALKRVGHKLHYTVQDVFDENEIAEFGHIRADIGGEHGAKVIDANMHMLRLLAENAPVRTEDDDMVETVVMAKSALFDGTRDVELVFRVSKHTGVLTLAANVSDTNDPDAKWWGMEGMLNG